jgi:protein-disulfide isomerase
MRSVVRRMTDEAPQLGMNLTPTLMINGRIVRAEQGIDGYQAAIQAAAASAN